MPKHVINLGTGIAQDVEFTPEEVAQNAIDAANHAVREQAEAAEEVRTNAIIADASRAEFLDALKTKTAAQIETFVRNKIDAGAVTNLATAQACLARIETALVVLLKLVALDNRR